jgi:hypothetical protein
MIETAYQNLMLQEITVGKSCRGYVKHSGACKVVLFGRRQIRRAKEVLNIMRNRGIDFDRLDERFFTAFSLYLVEERDFNFELLMEEIRRIAV